MKYLHVDSKGDLNTKVFYNDGKIIHHTVQDVEGYLKENEAMRNDRTGSDRFKKATVAKHLLHSMSIPLGFIQKMMNGQCCKDGKVYNIWSTDNDERHRAIMHVQSCHQKFMVISGKPIGKKQSWR